MRGARGRGMPVRVFPARARRGSILPGRREAEGRPPHQGEEGLGCGELLLSRH